MNKTAFAASAALAMVACPLTFGQTYDAYTSLVSSYGSSTNPLGTWSYGWTDGLSGAFSLFDATGDPEIDGGSKKLWYSTTTNLGYSPTVGFNGTGAVYDDGNVHYNVGDVILTGCGPDGNDYADVVWTAPVSGTYSLSGSFFGQQYNDNADYHVLIAGSDSFSGTITSVSASDPFSGTYALVAGQTVVFSAGPNGDTNLHPANIGLNATIQAVPEPASFVALCFGAMGALGRRSYLLPKGKLRFRRSGPDV